MIGNSFAIAAALSYGSALTGYVVFAARAAIGSRKSARARLLLLALIVTAAWGATCLAIVFAPSSGSVAVASVAETLRYAAWYVFLWHLLARSETSGTTPRAPRAAFVAGAILLGSTLIADLSVAGQYLGPGGQRLDYACRLGLAILGLVLVEQLVRRIEPQMRWGIKPLAIALAAVFGLDVFFYSDAMLFGHLDPDIWVARGLANAVVIPFLAIATARNTGWTIDLHLSRQAVFQSTALLISGAFLLAIAIAGYFVRYLGGDWGRALQIELLFAAIVLLMMIASSGRFRSRLKVFISKHFFSYRYDYREKWLRFTAALSTDGSVQRVHERTIMALADLVDSPGGLLWLKDDSDRYAVTASCNIGAIDASERLDGALAIFMSYTGWIISDSELRTNPSVYGGLARPSWLDLLPSPWLIIPLASGSNLLGFVVLTTPRSPIEVDWEVRDLLKTASRQAASYLGQIRATEALLEARKFDAFNRMSAFVVHDLKNLIAQLSLMLRNATRHSDNPAFQADMLSTVENVVERMNALMLQLRTTQNPIDPPRNVDIVGVVQRVCRAKSDARIVVEPREVTALATLGHEDRLEHVIGHLVQNALDASPAHAPVQVRVECDGDRALVTVCDKGIGMTREFVRDRLFKPFQTTKSSGMGIGVYESAQYVASIGGEIRIDSRPDEGTRVWLRMPLAETPAAAAIKVQAA